MGVVCPYCDKAAPLVTGREVYPHRVDLWPKKFYACLPCKAWVGCHPGTTNPLGRIANGELRKAKMEAHAVFDPLWQSGKMKRRDAYKWLASKLNITAEQCHIGEFNEEQCREVLAHVGRKKAHDKQRSLA